MLSVRAIAKRVLRYEATLAEHHVRPTLVADRGSSWFETPMSHEVPSDLVRQVYQAHDWTCMIFATAGFAAPSWLRFIHRR